MKNNLIAWLFIASGIIGLILNLLLVAGKIPMNSWYGFRIPKAFVSDSNWYAINTYGGRVLAVVCFTWILWGVVGLFDSLKYYKYYSTIGTVYVIASILVTIVVVLQYAKRL